MPCRVRVVGTLAVAQWPPRVADAAQREVRLDGVDPGHLVEPRLMGYPPVAMTVTRLPAG